MRVLIAVAASMIVGCKGKDDGDSDAGDCVAAGDLQAAIDASSPGDSLRLCAGTHSGAIVIAYDLDLVSDGGVTLDGAGQAPVIRVDLGASVTLSKLVVTHGADPLATAGGIDASAAGGLTLEGVVVRDNEGKVGGVLGPAAGTLTASASQILGNTGETGGLSVTSATLANTTISDNVGTFYGGGVQVSSGGVVTADETTVQGNHSDYYGGGVLLWDETHWTGGTIDGNDATTLGGGVAIWAPRNVTLEGVTITGNTTPADGGGLAIVPQRAGPVTLVGATVSGNSAIRGGGIHIAPGEHALTVQDSTIDGNHATYGGGIYFGAPGAPSNPLTLETTTISANTADYGAGMLLTAASQTALTDSAVSGNVAGFQGGGARLEAGSLVITTSDWEGNAPEDLWVAGIVVNGLGADVTVSCSADLQQCD